MTYPQQQGPYGGYQQQGYYGGHGGPPRKNNSTAIAIVIVVVAALAGLGITGFVAPGFFLGDDDKSSSSGGGSSSEGDSSPGGGAAEGGDSGIDQFASTLVEAADNQDKSELSGLKCADATADVTEAINVIGQTDGAELSDTREVSSDEYIVVVTITYQGQSAPFAATVVKDANDWCWQDFAPGSGSGGTGDDSDTAPGGPPSTRASDRGGSGDDGAAGDGEAFAQEFLDAINAKNAAEAEGMLCQDSPSNSIVGLVIGKSPQLEIDSAGRSSSSIVSYVLDGTMDGKPLRSGTVSVRVSGSGSPCVLTFMAS